MSTSFPFLATMVGVIELNMRLPGSIAFAAVPISPRTFVSPGFLLKSPISLFRMNPAPVTTTCEP